jgi:hypothetical protein
MGALQSQPAGFLTITSRYSGKTWRDSDHRARRRVRRGNGDALRACRPRVGVPAKWLRADPPCPTIVDAAAFRAAARIPSARRRPRRRTAGGGRRDGPTGNGRQQRWPWGRSSSGARCSASGGTRRPSIQPRDRVGWRGIFSLYPRFRRATRGGRIGVFDAQRSRRRTTGRLAPGTGGWERAARRSCQPTRPGTRNYRPTHPRRGRADSVLASR